MGLELSLNEAQIAGKIFYSSVPYHTAATMLNQVTSLMLAYATDNMSRSIVTTNAPISVTDNSTSFNPSDLNFLNCIEGIPFSFLDIANGISYSILEVNINFREIHRKVPSESL
jgi:hypothetical protein